MSETSKYRHLTVKYCQGNGIDIGSAGDPVVPRAIQIELPSDQFDSYNKNRIKVIEPQWLSETAFRDLPFKDRTLDYVYSSHLIEDYLDWEPILREWKRVVKIGGYVVVVVPDKEIWQQRLSEGQPPNLAHKHEAYPGELSEYFKDVIDEWEIVEDNRTLQFPKDYSILAVFKRLK